ncbi:MAG TPA: LacI family DNA-binding transcriptional regulator [Bryobacteraceae bacterium]|nr:LacI family DNA-binding transcriptional regulator [Bryobacteraceae bacterium]
MTIKDIARAASVSHSTVSRALRDSPMVGRETADRIRRIAQESGYRASAVARSLATSRTRTIGVVVTSIADPFAAEVVSGIEEAADSQGYSVILADSNADPEREVRVVTALQERRVDGIVVTSSRVGALYVPLLAQMRVPIVLVNNQHPSEFVHSVMIGNREAALAAVNHLVALGHRRIAYLGDRFGHQSDTERFAGYREALEQADLPFTPELVMHGDGKLEGGEQAMCRLLSLAARPTAVFCYNDMSAVGALAGIRTRGLRIPEDISVVGFDDLPIARYTWPPLTTVRQPKRQMGRLAVERLLSHPTGIEENTTVPGELIVRASTAPLMEST